MNLKEHKVQGYIFFKQARRGGGGDKNLTFKRFGEEY